MFPDKFVDLLKHFGEIFTLFDTMEKGSVTFQTGQHAQEIRTRHMPKHVWISIADQGDMAVCQGGLDSFSVTNLPDGFVVYADVNSTFVQLNYIVDF